MEWDPAEIERLARRVAKQLGGTLGDEAYDLAYNAMADFVIRTTVTEPAILWLTGRAAILNRLKQRSRFEAGSLDDEDLSLASRITARDHAPRVITRVAIHQVAATLLPHYRDVLNAWVTSPTVAKAAATVGMPLRSYARDLAIAKRQFARYWRDERKV